MSRLVDLGKKAINLEEVTGFSIDRKNYLFIPCFREVSQLVASKSFFGKESHSVKTYYEFYHHIPYAVVLGEKEKPFPGDTYAYKTAGEIIGVDLVRKFTKVPLPLALHHFLLKNIICVLQHICKQKLISG